MDLGDENIVLEPAFDPSVTQYIVTVPNDTPAFDLTATPCEGATTEITGNDGFSFGKENKITITVTNPKNNTSKKYVINVRFDSEPPAFFLHDFETSERIGCEAAADFQTSLTGLVSESSTQ